MTRTLAVLGTAFLVGCGAEQGDVSPAATSAATGQNGGDELTARGDLWNPTAWDAMGLRIAAQLDSDLDAVKLYDAFVLAREAAWEKYADYRGEKHTDSDFKRVFFTFLETGSPIFYSNGQEIVFELKPSIYEN